MTTDKNPKTTLNLPTNTAAALCYATGFLPYAGWLSGLLFLFFEHNKTVRFHALQSIALFGGLAVLQILFANTVLFSSLFSLLYVCQFILWLMLSYKTYHGDNWVLPKIGDWAAKQVK